MTETAAAPDPAADEAGEAIAGVQAHLDRGDPLLAYDLAQGALARWPGHVRLRQLQGLALARSGDEAKTMLAAVNKVFAAMAAHDPAQVKAVVEDDAVFINDQHANTWLALKNQPEFVGYLITSLGKLNPLVFGRLGICGYPAIPKEDCHRMVQSVRKRLNRI